MAEDISPDDLLYRMMLLHLAYHKIENCLQHLKHLVVFNADLPCKLQTYFEKEIAIVSTLSN